MSMNHQKLERLPGAQQLEETDQYGECVKSRYWVQREIALCLPVTPFIYKLFFAVVQTVSGVWGCIYCLVDNVVSIQESWGKIFTDMVRSRGEETVGEPASDKHYLLVSEGNFIIGSSWRVYVLISLCAAHHHPAELCSARRIRPGGKRRAALPAAREVWALPWALTSLALSRNSLPTICLPWENWLSLGSMIPRSPSLGNW